MNISEELLTEDSNLYFKDHITKINLKSRFKSIHKGSAALLGFVCDEGVRRNNGRTGATAGPVEIRKALGRLAWHHTGNILDAGNIHCSGQNLEKAQKDFASAIKILHKNDCFPVGLGGGHEIAFGHFLGLRDKTANARLGIINFDAHFDMRTAHNGIGNSGTPFYQVAQNCLDSGRPFHYLNIGLQKENNSALLFQTARKLKANYIEAPAVHRINQNQLLKTVSRFLENLDFVYISICMDVFNAAQAPGVSAVNPLGIHPDIALLLIRHIFKSSNVIGLDIAEVNPRYDIDNRTSKLAAAIVFHSLLYNSEK